jgi:hypothetical protein
MNVCYMRDVGLQLGLDHFKPTQENEVGEPPRKRGRRKVLKAGDQMPGAPGS